MARDSPEPNIWSIRYPDWDTTREAFENDENSLPKPPPATIDRLLYRETLQMRALGGLRASEYGALQDIDAYGPACRVSELAGAIENESDLEFVEVDETKWFKIFRRERWSSYKHPDPSGLSIDIDDDVTWAKLSRVLEIANRILTEAVSHEWLASFLKQDSHEIRRDVMVGSKNAKPRKGTIIRVKPVSPESRLSPAEARKVLDDIADTFFWGFFLREEWPAAIGLTMRHIDKEGRQLKWMRVGIEYFQPLFRNIKFQDPEGRQAAFLVTKTHGISGHMHRSYLDKHPKEPLLATEVSVLWPYNHSADVAKFRPYQRTTSRFLFQAYAYLWLATLPVRKKPTPSSRPTSRPLHPERMSIPKAAGGQELIGLATGQGSKTSVATVNYLHNSNTPSHDKELCMQNAKLSFLRWKVLGNVSPEVAKGFEHDWRDIRRMMDQSPYDHGWLTYNYNDLPTHVHREMHYPIGASQVERLPLNRNDLDDADLPSWAVARPAIAQAPVPSQAKSAEIAPLLRHYHVGEIGDHQRVGGGVKWFVHKADGDDRHLIYDFSGILSSEHGWDAATREKLTMRPDPSGPVLNRVLRTGDMNEKTRKLCMKNGPIGQVMRFMRTEDIRLAYNRDRLSCVAFGNHVFDLTTDLKNFQLPQHMHHLLVIIKAVRQENPLIRAVNLGFNPNVIVNFLRPYQIGIRTQELERHSLYRLRCFTLNEVKWHVYTEAGIYTIFRGDSVIDLTDFMKLHPGGMEILQSVAGKDCTREFEQYHQSPTGFLGVTTHVYLERLQVGRIVPEQSPGVISPDQIVIRNQVFGRKANLSMLSEIVLEGVRSLLASKELEGYWGKDVTAQMDIGSPPRILCTLFDTKWFVVAKVVAPIDTLPFMDDQMLGRMDGKVEPWGFHESYVSDGKYIYSLTSYLRYGKPDRFNELLKARAGTTLSASLQDQELKRWLWSDFQYRIIAQHGPNQVADFDWKRSFRPIPEDSPDLKGDGSSKVTPAVSFAQAAKKGNATSASNQIVQPIQDVAGTKRKQNGQLKVQKKSIKAVTTSRFTLPEQVAAGVKRKSSPTPVRPYKKVVKESRGSASGPSSGIEGLSETAPREAEKPRQEWEWKDLYMYR
ncbi:hypothetical protein CaCOL14_007322 [Colletotrichum acutatum]